MEEIKIFAPATVANLSCGFDVLGCCLQNVGDEMLVKKNDLNELRITKITGADLPMEIHKNVAGVAVLALLERLDSKQGFDIEIDKKIRSGSGIGSSAASSAGAVYAVNKLLDDPFTSKELIEFAMQGELLASGNAHADNVAPALLGGFSLVRSYDPLEILALPAPSEIRMVVLHPMIEIKTRESRAIIKQNVTLASAIAQWGNLGAFVSALYTCDYELMGRSLHDAIVEPVRSILIPYFDDLKKLALDKGALGFGISGSGPSVFAMCQGDTAAEEVRAGFVDFLQDKEMGFELHVSEINKSGIRIL
ncbi:homoserine kinase [Christiangramia sp. ASW11-125]|uniref:homoserine kinase n=1 Tax=Christiangramia sp. ASW11-125 TaxID=3400701 RepID=UPI003AB043FB